MSVLRASILKVFLPRLASLFPSSALNAKTASTVFSQEKVFAQPEIPARRESASSIKSDFSFGASI